MDVGHPLIKSKTVDEVLEDEKQSGKKEGRQHLHEVKFTEETLPATAEDTTIPVTCRDPIFVNPNSYESVKEVFCAIGKDFNIRKYCNKESEADREWLLIVCDGVPYTLGQRVIRETFRCQVCSESFFGKDVFVEHCTKAHQLEEAHISFSPEFDWIHLRIGFGHYEMNMLRSFIELNWEVMMKDLAVAMGFRSEAAQKYAKKGSDHHKAWELLSILYEGSLQELLLPYIRCCLQATPPLNPTPQAFLNWTTTVKNPRYQYLQEQILTYAQSILNFRKGVRYNDKELIMAGKYKHAPIFHARNHPKYQLIELLETRNDIIMPPAVKTFVHGNQSISRSGTPGRGEDMDFQLENINKRSKVWTPKGVPCKADWMRTFRNLEKLDQMRQATLRRMGCEDPKGVVAASSSHNPQPNEVQEWRATLRESGFLDNPHTENIMTSVGGQPLDDQLVMFTGNAWSRRRSIFRMLFEEESETHMPDPVFVVPEERESYHDIRNQTKAHIASKIEQLISQLDEDVRPDFLETWTRSVQKKKKEDYLSFYEKLQEELSEALEHPTVLECRPTEQ